MDDSELIASSYLRGQGYSDVAFEPDGNGTPDFVLNHRIAVEVRRLNQNHEAGGQTHGLEEDARPLWDSLSKVVRSLGTNSPSENWYVSFSFRRPYGSRKSIVQRTKQVLSHFMTSTEQRDLHWQLTPGFRLELWRGETRHPHFFTMGGYIDYDNGGWVINEMLRNLAICIDQKTRKRSNAKRPYSEWWLILVDHIGYGLPEAEDREHFRQLAPPAPDWDRIILLSPLNAHCVFVL